LHVGAPPHPAEGLYRLTEMIVHYPVSWPARHFSPIFRDFVERLLVKNPRSRMCWPELLDHPYVKDHVRGEVHAQGFTPVS